MEIFFNPRFVVCIYNYKSWVKVIGGIITSSWFFHMSLRISILFRLRKYMFLANHRTKMGKQYYMVSIEGQKVHNYKHSKFLLQF